MSKLNPQKASAYVGPGVLRKGGNITPVPNGPLIKKKGQFKGSTLKKGGTIKKAQTGIKLTPQQEARKKLDSVTAIQRKITAAKNDKVFEDNAKAQRTTRADVRVRQKKEKNKKNAGLEGMQDGSKRTKKTGSCVTGETGGGQSTVDNKRNGGLIKRADGSMSKRGLWDNIRANKGSGKKPTKQMLVQEKKIKAKK